jgi:hypothetical protein
MKIGNIERILNKWQFYLNTSDYAAHRIDPMGWRVFRFYIFKIVSLPEEGVSVSKENYKGFRLEFSYWLPLDRA